MEGLVSGIEANPEKSEKKLGAVDSPVTVFVELVHHRSELRGGEL